MTFIQSQHHPHIHSTILAKHTSLQYEYNTLKSAASKQPRRRPSQSDWSLASQVLCNNAFRKQLVDPRPHEPGELKRFSLAWVHLECVASMPCPDQGAQLSLPLSGEQQQQQQKQQQQEQQKQQKQVTMLSAVPIVPSPLGLCASRRVGDSEDGSDADADVDALLSGAAAGLLGRDANSRLLPRTLAISALSASVSLDAPILVRCVAQKMPCAVLEGLLDRKRAVVRHLAGIRGIRLGAYSKSINEEKKESAKEEMVTEGKRVMAVCRDRDAQRDIDVLSVQEGERELGVVIPKRGPEIGQAHDPIPRRLLLKGDRNEDDKRWPGYGLVRIDSDSDDDDDESTPSEDEEMEDLSGCCSNNDNENENMNQDTGHRESPELCPLPEVPPGLGPAPRWDQIAPPPAYAHPDLSPLPQFLPQPQMHAYSHTQYHASLDYQRWRELQVQKQLAFEYWWHVHGQFVYAPHPQQHHAPPFSYSGHFSFPPPLPPPPPPRYPHVNHFYYDQSQECRVAHPLASGQMSHRDERWAPDSVQQPLHLPAPLDHWGPRPNYAGDGSPSRFYLPPRRYSEGCEHPHRDEHRMHMAVAYA